MLNKMPCAADKLNLLEPTMIQFVVEASTFKLGSQYLAEDRVRIAVADAELITSVVIGASGPHKQTIHLKDGTLITQCSCTSTAQPLCRHCVAVLLAYHRWGNPQPPETSPGKPMTEAPPEARQSATPVAEISLRDLMAFVEWFQVAVSALERGHPLPESPKLGTAEVRGWIDTLSDLAKEWDRYKSQMRGTAADLEKQGSQLESLLRSVKGASAAL
ncbi:MAG: hypothetical protein VST65_04060 [Nitrospirota bacterium]|nr:hypothetical protein [Nitrospirota bacterium]